MSPRMDPMPAPFDFSQQPYNQPPSYGSSQQSYSQTNPLYGFDQMPSTYSDTQSRVLRRNSNPRPTASSRMPNSSLPSVSETPQFLSHGPRPGAMSFRPLLQESHNGDASPRSSVPPLPHRNRLRRSTRDAYGDIDGYDNRASRASSNYGNNRTSRASSNDGNTSYIYDDYEDVGSRRGSLTASPLAANSVYLPNCLRRILGSKYPELASPRLTRMKMTLTMVDLSSDYL